MGWVINQSDQRSLPHYDLRSYFQWTVYECDLSLKCRLFFLSFYANDLPVNYAGRKIIMFWNRSILWKVLQIIIILGRVFWLGVRFYILWKIIISLELQTLNCAVDSWIFKYFKTFKLLNFSIFGEFFWVLFNYCQTSVLSLSRG